MNAFRELLYNCLEGEHRMLVFSQFVKVLELLKAELEAAIVAVRDAATVCQSVQKNLVTAATLEKKDRSPVTVADFASQALVCASLAANSKVSEVVGEEDAAELRESGAEGRSAPVTRTLMASAMLSAVSEVGEAASPRTSASVATVASELTAMATAGSEGAAVQRSACW